MATESPAGPATPHRILVVDDEEIVLVALSETLRRDRYEVVTVSNPLVALEVLRKETFSVILIDHEMPLLTGLELLAQAKEIQPDTPRILITAVLSLDTVINAINKGEVFRFIVKPWLREELLVTVKNAVQRFELMRQHSQLQARTLALSEQAAQFQRSLAAQEGLVAGQNTRLTELARTLDQTRQRSLELGLRALRAFHPALGEQARRAVRIGRALAETVSLAPADRRTLETSACLHDLGLLGVPRPFIKTWLEDPKALTDAQRALIEQHPIVGQELADLTDPLGGAGLAIRAHHERFDGRGYPDGLAGHDIPWLGRLLAVAVCAAATPGGDRAALEAVRAGIGTTFDPKAVDAFLHAWTRVTSDRQERVVPLGELRPGMVLAKGIYTANGLLLVPEGQELNAAYIETLLSHHRVHPITQSLTVYC